MGTHRVDVATLHPVVRIIQRWRDIVHVGGNNQKQHRLVLPSRRPSHGPLDPHIFEQGLQNFEPSICQSLLRHGHARLSGATFTSNLVSTYRPTRHGYTQSPAAVFAIVFISACIVSLALLNLDSLRCKKFFGSKPFLSQNLSNLVAISSDALKA